MRMKFGYTGYLSYIYVFEWFERLIKIKVMMLDLSIQDKFDGLGKVDELRSAIGENYLGDNVLFSVSKNGNRCIVLNSCKSEFLMNSNTSNRMFS